VLGVKHYFGLNDVIKPGVFDHILCKLKPDIFSMLIDSLIVTAVNMVYENLIAALLFYHLRKISPCKIWTTVFRIAVVCKPMATYRMAEEANPIFISI